MLKVTKKAFKFEELSRQAKDNAIELNQATIYNMIRDQFDDYIDTLFISRIEEYGFKDVSVSYTQNAVDICFEDADIEQINKNFLFFNPALIDKYAFENLSKSSMTNYINLHCCNGQIDKDYFLFEKLVQERIDNFLQRKAQELLKLIKEEEDSYFSSSDDSDENLAYFFNFKKQYFTEDGNALIC